MLILLKLFTIRLVRSVQNKGTSHQGSVPVCLPFWSKTPIFIDMQIKSYFFFFLQYLSQLPFYICFWICPLPACGPHEDREESSRCLLSSFCE